MASTPSTAVVSGVGVEGFAVGGDQLVVKDGSTVRVFTTGGTAVRTTAVTSYLGDVAVDPDGSTYTAVNHYSVAKKDASGAEVWTIGMSGLITGLYGRNTPDGWQLAVVADNVAGSRLFDKSGALVRASAVTGNNGQPTAEGGLVTVSYTGIDYWSATDALLGAVTANGYNTGVVPRGGALHFTQQAGAVVGPDGTTYVGDGDNGIFALDKDGIVIGAVPASITGRFKQRTPMVIQGNTLFYIASAPGGGAVGVRSLPVDALLGMAATFQNRLGFGAGLTTGTTDSYVAPGQAPAVRLAFDPWWARDADKLSVRLSVRSWKDARVGVPAKAETLTLTAARLHDGISVAVPAIPGPAEVEATLVKGGVDVSATCLDVAVGAPGDTLDFASLPAGSGWGGPAPTRDVALSDVLGTGLSRASLDWSRLLPSGLTGPIDFSSYDDELNKASAEAARRGTTLEVQLGKGGIEKGLVSAGTWGSRVQEVVTHYKDVIHNWEAWNEPNNTYGTPAAYVKAILIPFEQAVHAADPTAKVVGGTVCGMDGNYWKGIGIAGGFQHMDIVGLHPYTGHNRSLEEQDTVQALQWMRRLLADSGAPNLPMWITEHSWWSDGLPNWYSSADNSVRAQLWYRSLGIDKWAYFLSEGGWGDNGQTFSAIQVNDVVKPTALGLMQARTRLAGRAFKGFEPIAMPHATAMRFGPAVDGGGDLIALWTDDLPGTIAVTGNGSTASVYDEYGAPSTLPLDGVAHAVSVDGSVTYLELPAGSTVSLSAAESFGADLARTGTATASSNIGNNTPDKAIDGLAIAGNVGHWDASPAWANAVGDASPWLAISLASPQVVDRVVLATHSQGSTAPGVRDVDVQVKSTPDSDWKTVAQSRGQYVQRMREIAFPAQQVSAVRINVLATNYGAYNDGAVPGWAGSVDQQMGDPNFYGAALIDEVELYQPGEKLIPPPPAAVTNPPTPPSIGSTSPVPPQTTPTAIQAPAGTTIRQGQAVVRVAYLVNQGGRGLPSQSMQIFRRPSTGGSWSRVGTVTTGAQGQASVRLVPTVNTDIVFTYSGTPSYAASRGSATHLLVSKAVSISTPSLKVRRGNRIAFHGAVSPSATGTMVLQRLSGHKWVTVAYVALSRSRYVFSYRCATRGAIYLRVVRLADTPYVASTSRSLRLSVS